MADYITISDITDTIATGFTTEMTNVYIPRSTEAVNDLAETQGIESEDIETNPVHFKIKRYAVAYALRELCLDKIGFNNVEIAEIEKYRIKYMEYNNRVNQLATQITPPMFTGEVDEAIDRFQSGELEFS
jgi:hypothetical protein